MAARFLKMSHALITDHSVKKDVATTESCTPMSADSGMSPPQETNILQTVGEKRSSPQRVTETEKGSLENLNTEEKHLDVTTEHAEQHHDSPPKKPRLDRPGNCSSFFFCKL